ELDDQLARVIVPCSPSEHYVVSGRSGVARIPDMIEDVSSVGVKAEQLVDVAAFDPGALSSGSRYGDSLMGLPLVLLGTFRRASSALARASHVVRIFSSSSSVRCSTPTNELWALLTRMSSSSLT